MSDPAPPLQFWLDRLRAGGSGALEARNELIRHSRERFRLLTRQMLRGFPGLRQWEDTSDVLQNVLMRIDRVLLALDVPTPRDFLSLAACQIRRELIDLTRHHFGPHGQGTHQIPPGQIGRGSPPDPADQRDDPCHLARWSELHETIANLGEDERELFELLFYQGMNQIEAAALLELPVRTLQRRWQKARTNFMTRLGGDLPF